MDRRGFFGLAAGAAAVPVLPVATAAERSLALTLGEFAPLPAELLSFEPIRAPQFLMPDFDAPFARYREIEGGEAAWGLDPGIAALRSVALQHKARMQRRASR